MKTIKSVLKYVATFLFVAGVLVLTAYALSKIASGTSSKKPISYSFSAETVYVRVNCFDGIVDNNVVILEDYRNIVQNLFRAENGYLDSVSLEIHREMTIAIKGSEEPLCKVPHVITYAGFNIPVENFGFLYPGFVVERAYYSKRGAERLEGNFTFRVLDRFENVPFVFSLPDSDGYEIVSSKSLK